MTRGTYITIQDWMLVLGIGGNDLLAYALVYGFCQDGKSCFKGSYDYIAGWLGCNRSTVIRVVARLVDAGLLRKEDRFDNGVKFCALYALIPEGVQNATGGGNLQQGVAICDRPSGKMQHNNNRDNNRDNNNPLISSPFDLYKALLAEGVNAATAHDWLQVRKTKRLANTETGWRETLAEIRKTGYTAEYCIRTAIAQGWGGFRADWLDRLLNGTGTARARKVDNITFMLEQRERRLAERARQQQGPSYDINDLPDEQ